MFKHKDTLSGLWFGHFNFIKRCPFCLHKFRRNIKIVLPPLCLVTVTRLFFIYWGFVPASPHYFFHFIKASCKALFVKSSSCFFKYLFTSRLEALFFCCFALLFSKADNFSR